MKRLPMTGSHTDTKQFSTLIEWNDQDSCFIGSAYPLVGQCCHGETRSDVAGKLETIIKDLLDDLDWLRKMLVLIGQQTTRPVR